MSICQTHRALGDVVRVNFVASLHNLTVGFDERQNTIEHYFSGLQ